MVAQVQTDSIYPVMPYWYKFGLIIQVNNLDPSTILSISNGQCRDSQNMIDMGVGSFFLPPNQGSPVDLISLLEPIQVNGATNGPNGLDVGSLAANTMYAVYIIGDSRGKKSVAGLFSLASNNGTPHMPAGYDSYRLIGYWPTGSDSHFLIGAYTGWQGMLIFKYNTPQATAITAGSAPIDTLVNLASVVPPIDNCVVSFQFIFNADEAGNRLVLKHINGGDTVQAVAPVPGTTALYYGYADVQASIFDSGLVTPYIFYHVSTEEDVVAINVAGFTVPV